MTRFKLILISAFALVLFASNLKAQTVKPCVTDEWYKDLIQNNPDLIGKRDTQEQQIREYINSHFPQGGGNNYVTTDNLTIPVVVHVIIPPGNSQVNISDAQIDSQIVAANRYLEETGVNIKICLATLKPDGTSNWNNPTNKKGVNRYSNAPLPTFYFADGYENSSVLKNMGAYYPPERYLNIYIVKEICSTTEPGKCDPFAVVAGLGTFPVPDWKRTRPYDGIFMRYDVFGNNATGATFNLLPGNNQGKVFIHELGHYLDLYHTFDTTCANYQDSLNTGDFVEDTPPIFQPTTGCPAFRASCSGGAAQVNNHMDYTFDPCKNLLTPGQNKRMYAAISLERSELVSNYNLQRTGINCTPVPLIANFRTNSRQYCKNEQIPLFCDIFNGTYEWTFPGGTPATSTSQNPSIQYSTSGNYDITLEVTKGGVTEIITKSGYFFVDECTPLVNKKNGTWYFGEFAGIDFRSGKPLPFKSVMKAFEGTAMAFDENDDLLFYTDNRVVFNRNDDTLGVFLIDNISTAQGPLIIQNPNESKPSQYYIITAPTNGSPLNFVITYSIIDMNLNGGLGGFIPDSINLPIIKNQSVLFTETLQAIPHCNGKDIWIITHDMSAVDKFYSYLLTPKGFNPPIISNHSPYDQVPFTMKASPNNKYLAIQATINVSNKTDIFEFDQSTGMLTLKTSVPYASFALSFSPNSQFLYIAANEGFIQYDLNDNTVNIDHAHNNGNNDFRVMEIGPDRKIYMSNDRDFCTIINYPDIKNNYGINRYGLKLTDSTSNSFSFPQIINGKPTIPQYDFTSTFNSCYNFSFTNTSNCGTGYTWKFGDGATSTLENPSHTYAGSGNYNVMLIVNSGSLKDTVIKQVKVGNADLAIIGDSVMCMNEGSIYTAAGINLATYQWTTDAGITPLTSSTAANLNLYWKDSASTYTIKLVVTNASGCKDSVTEQVIVYPIPISTITYTNTTFCQGDSLLLTGNTGAGYTYQWQRNNTNISGATNINYTAKQFGFYRVKVTANECPQYSSQVSITVNPVPQVPVIMSTGATTFCTNGQDFTTLYISNIQQGVSLTYQWYRGGFKIPGATTTQVDAKLSGTYSVIAMNSDSCTAQSQSITITANPKPTTPIITITDSLLCPLETGTLSSNVTFGFGLTHQWYYYNNPSGGTQPTSIAGASGPYKLKITTANGCSAFSNIISVTTSQGLGANAGTDREICNGLQTTIGQNPVATGGISPYTYKWTPAPALPSSDTDETPQVAPTAQTTYTVIVTDAYGCTTNDAVVVTVKPNGPFNYDAMSSFNSANPKYVHEITGTQPSLLFSPEPWDDGNTVRVRGVLYIKNGAKLTISNGTIVEFTPDYRIPGYVGLPNSGIIVEEGGILNVTEDAVLKGATGCDNMWYGVQVFGNSNIAAQNGTINIDEGGTIRDALYGVSLYQSTVPDNNPSPAEKGRGKIDADGANFINNHVSIQFSGISSPPIKNDSRIKNCNFSCPVPLIDGSNEGTRHHISLSNVKGVGIIGNNTFEGNGGFSDASKRGIAIVSYDAGYDVVPYRGYPFSTDSLPNRFNYLYKGIDAYSMGGISTWVRIRGNEFIENTQGIAINGLWGPEIISNKFTIPAGTNNLAGKAIGIYTYGSLGYFATKNEFSTLNPNQYTYGFVLSNCDRFGSQIYNNSFTGNFYAANQMELDNGSTAIGCNDYTGNNSYDWAVTSGKVTMQGICDPLNPDPASPAGNDFGYCLNSSSKEQIHLNPGLASFLYNSHDTPNNNITPSCVDLTTNFVLRCASAGNYSKSSACPPNIPPYTPMAIAPPPPPPICLLCPLDPITIVVATIQNMAEGIQKQILQSEIIRDLLSQGDIDRALRTLDVNDNGDIRVMLPTYVAQNKCNEARQLLNNMQTTTGDDIAYYQLFDMITQVCESGRAQAALSPSEKQLVADIAVGETRASVNAQSIMASINQTTYTRIPEEIMGSSARFGNIATGSKFLTAIPNPFSGSTLIKYQLEYNATDVRIVIVDVTGRKIADQNLSSAQKGEYKFDIENRNGGVYFCQLWADGKLIQTEKLVITK